jgi:membrane-associated protein
VILPIIQTIGIIGIFLFVFAESGLFFGFFLPGDSLLFTAGILAAAGHFNLWLLFIGCFFAAILGDTVGYWFGYKIGPKIFSREDSFFWNKKNIDKTSLFYQKYGNKTIVLARFVPVVRTFAPIMAGVGKMNYQIFLFWNIIGGLVWTGGMIFGGYFLGSKVKNIDNYILPIVVAIIFLSFVPIFIEYIKNKRENTKKIEN